MRSRRVAIAVMACGTAVFAAACSSPPSSSSAASAASSNAPVSSTAPATSPSASPVAAGGKFDSCSVVTQAEAAAALGQSVTAGVLGKATVEGGLACVFYGPSAPAPRDPDVAQPDSVRVVVVNGPNALTWYQNYKAKVKAQPVTGYGNQAYYDGYASLSVLKGNYYLRVAVAPAGAPPSLAAEKKIAAAILPNL